LDNVLIQVSEWNRDGSSAAPAKGRGEAETFATGLGRKDHNRKGYCHGFGNSFQCIGGTSRCTEHLVCRTETYGLRASRAVTH
jgi:hypothetical protein